LLGWIPVVSTAGTDQFKFKFKFQIQIERMNDNGHMALAHPVSFELDPAQMGTRAAWPDAATSRTDTRHHHRRYPVMCSI
jgi:hypothetical protein